MDAGFLWLFKWLNRFLWVIGFILLFSYDILLSSIHTETGIFPIVSTFLMLLFRKHSHSRSINLGILIFAFLQASADGLISEQSVKLSIWVLLMFMIWHEHLKAERQLLKQDVAYSIKLVDIQSLEEHENQADPLHENQADPLHENQADPLHENQADPLNAWSFRLSIILWLFVGSLIFFSDLMIQRDQIFDDQVRQLMSHMIRSKDDWFLLYRSEIMFLFLLFLFVWYLLFESILRQKLEIEEKIVGWQLWGSLILGIVFLLISL